MTTTTARARIPTRNRSWTNRMARANERVLWGVGGCICKRHFVVISLLGAGRGRLVSSFLENTQKRYFLENASYGLGFIVYGLKFLLSYVGAETTQKGRFYSEFTYFPLNFL